jgi:hypothetical protein
MSGAIEMAATTKKMSKGVAWFVIGSFVFFAIVLGVTLGNAMKSDEAYRQTPEYQRLAAENEGWKKLMDADTKAREPEQKASEDALIEYGKTH